MFNSTSFGAGTAVEDSDLGNFIHHRIRVQFIVTITFLVLNTIFFGLFLVSRWLQKMLIDVGVGLMSVAYLCNLGSVIISLMAWKYYSQVKVTQFQVPTYSYASVDLPEGLQIFEGKAYLASTYIYFCGITSAKLAVLSLYLKIFKKTAYRHIVYSTGLVVVLAWIAAIFVTSFSCRPLAQLWNPQKGRCKYPFAVYQVTIIPNVVTDLVILILPFSVIWKLQMGLGQKVGLSLTFFVGSLGIVATLVRLYYSFFTTISLDWSINWVLVVVEPGTYLLAATMPSLKPLADHVQKTVIHGKRKLDSWVSTLAVIMDDEPIDIEICAESKAPRRAPSSDLGKRIFGWT